jgi:gentisate 1,2-dioxygenase
MSSQPQAEAGPDYSSLIGALAQVHAQPLWDRYMGLVPREPRPADAPHIWRLAEMRPLIERAVREVSMEDAERRVLLLTHPAFGGSVATTTNLSGGLQILEPGEHAPAHRHTLSALRFVMSGSGAVTIVDGKRCPMEEGDLILTPTWTWHEHVNEGSSRMVWFDGLDVPLAKYLDSVFLQLGPASRPADDLARVPDEVFDGGGPLPAGSLPAAGYSPQFRYPWTSALRALRKLPARPDGSKLLRYTNPVTGGAVIPSLDCHLLELGAGCVTASSRSTSNAICVVAEGEGKTRVGDELIEWTRGDVFTLPHWKWISHHAAAASRLFLMSDREMMARLGYLREETESAASAA